MLCAVVGNGPRTGTSFVMRKLHEAGLPVVWDTSLNIPGAGYDILPNDLLRVQGGIVKAWPTALRVMLLNRVVILRRDPATQLRSMYEQQAREEAEGVKLHDGDMTPEYALAVHQKALAKWLINPPRHTRILDIKTEDLDVRMDEIVDWFAAVFQRRAA